MTYYFARTLADNFDSAVARTIESLKREGFGIISDIDVEDTFRKKLGADFRHYRILGACNPQLAHEAIKLEDKVGTMLPCNVVVQDAGNGKTEVAAIDPVASMKAINNEQLKKSATEVQRRLRRAVEGL